MSDSESINEYHLQYIENPTDEICVAAIQQDGDMNNDIMLCADAMRCVNDFLMDNNDTLALSKVDDAWEHALKENVDDIWIQEWAVFKAENQNEKWFTENVYTLPYKQSRIASTLNAFRKLARKEEKEYQSFQQKMSKEFQLVENPTPIQLLIVNGQRMIDSMSKKELDQIMRRRPKVRMIFAKTGCIVAAPVLIALGIAMLPLTAITFTATMIAGSKGRGGTNGTVMAMGGAPSLIPWVGAAAALNVVVTEKNMRKIPELYKSFNKYNSTLQEKEETKPINASDLSLRYTQ